MEQTTYEETTKKVGNSTFVLVPRDVKKNQHGDSLISFKVYDFMEAWI